MKFLMLGVALLCLSGFSFKPIEENTITVKAGYGSTVWNICEEHYDKDEVRNFRDFVDDVRAENGLFGDNVLQAGQDLVIRKRVRK